MSGFLYYAPSSVPITSDRARQLGLAYAFESGAGARFGYAGVSRGPDGASGYVFADSERVPAQKRKYVADSQQWRKIFGAPGVWVGLWNDAKPGPVDLRRGEALRGHLVKLADENEWLVPVARCAVENNGEQLQWYKALPTISTLGDDGRWTPGAVAAKYAPLWDVATRYASAIALAGSNDDDECRYILEFDNIHEAAVLALQTNYRLGPTEVSMLGLLTDLHCVRILQALIDYPTVARWLDKKKRLGEEDRQADGNGSNASDGEPA